MKKAALLNAPLSAVIAGMGHGDRLVLADAGLPVPPGVPVIDLAVSAGVPSLLAVLSAVMTELEVESFIVARELAARDPGLFERVAGLVPRAAARSDCGHEEFKRLCVGAKAVVRTGEFTPYANVILCSGVTF